MKYINFNFYGSIINRLNSIILKVILKFSCMAISSVTIFYNIIYSGLENIVFVNITKINSFIEYISS